MRSFRHAKRGFHSRGVPLARKQRYWIQTADIVAETAGSVTALTLLDWSAVPGIGSMGALSKGVKMLRVLFDLRSLTTLATAETRNFGVNLDDATDSGAWDPSNTTASNQRVPDRVFRWGVLFTPATASLAAGFQPFTGSLDLTRDVGLKAFLRPDSRLFCNVSPAAAAGNQLSWQVRSRVLIEIG